MTTTMPGDDVTPGVDAPPAPTRVDLDRPIAVHELTYLDEGEEVTVGRADIDSYAVLPADGAALLRQLADGVPPARAAEWYAETYGETVDMTEFLETLAELEFLRTADTAPAPDPRPLRWVRTGRAFFSPVAWVVYGALAVWCLVTMVRSPELAPHYRNIFFSPYVTVIELVLFLGQIPLLLVHESFHALAGRRLGLRSRLSLGRRLYYIVFETTMDGLVTVPRRARYLPMLAGMVADAIAFCVLTLLADHTRTAGGELSTVGGVCRALAFMTVLRFVWQFYFYLQTDIYHVICTTIGTIDLQTTARRTLRNRVNRLLGRHDRVLDESRWHPRDRAVARWYSWLLLVGYAVSIGTLVLAVAPTAYRFLSGVFARFGGTGTSAGELTDSVVFLALNLIQAVAIAALVIRDRRRRPPTTSHVLS